MRHPLGLQPNNYADMGDEKMAIRYTAWVITLLCGAWALPAMADEGAYLTFNVGQSKAMGACKSPNVQGIQCIDKSPAYRIAYGYQYTPTWGLEASWGDLGRADGTGRTSTGAPYNWSFKAMGIAVVATGTVHIGDTFAMYAKVGGVRAEITGVPGIGNSNRTAPAFGIGVQFDVSQHAAIRIQTETFGSHNLTEPSPLTGLYTTTNVKLGMNSLSLYYKY